MSDLEKLLREASHTPQAGGPPPGGFERLQQDLVAGGAGPAYLLPLLYGMLGVLLVGFGIWYLTPALTPAPQPLKVPVSAPLPAAAEITTEPTTKPEYASVVPLSGEQQSGRGAVRAETQHREDKINAAGSLQPVRTPSPTPPTQQPGPRTPAPPAVPPRAYANRGASLLSPLTIPAPGLTLRMPQFSVEAPARTSPGAYWRVEATAYPFFLRGYRNATLLRAAGPDDFSLPYVIDGNTVELALTDYRNDEYRVFTPVLLLGVHREFAGGMSVGIGLTRFTQRQNPIGLAEQLSSPYVQYRDRSERYLLAQASVGYRFRRRYRLSFPAEVSLLRTFYGVEREEEVIRTRNGELHLQRRSRETGNFLTRPSPLIPVASIGADYRFTPNWRAGVRLGALPNGSVQGISAGVGLSVNYAFR